MGDFQGSETTLRDTITVYLCYYTFVNTHVNKLWTVGDDDVSMQVD